MSFYSSAAIDDGKVEAKEDWDRSKTPPSILTKSTWGAWKRVQKWQIFECKQTTGVVKDFKPDGSADKDLVSGENDFILIKLCKSW